MQQRIILAFDGSLDSLNRLLRAEKLTSWRGDLLFLVAIIPRPVQVCVYEPHFFSPSISLEEFEEIKSHLNEGRDQLLKNGFDAKAEVVYDDSSHSVMSSLQKIKPDLVVAVRRPQPQKNAHWRKKSITVSLIDWAPCALLIL